MVWESLLKKATNKLAADRSTNYRNFVRQAISHKGAQVFHRMLKKQTVEIARPTDKDPNTTAEQAHADEKISEWKAIWGASEFPVEDEDVPQEMIKCCTRVSTNYWMTRHITKSEIDNLRRIISSFNGNTAVAYDNLSPRALANLSDTAIAHLLRMYKRCEAEGRWPTAWRMATMVMIPKSEIGKWRLIAMLVTPYRVWARAAGEDVSRWMASLDREWIANGPGKAAESAAYEIALDTEAAQLNGDMVNVTVMADLEKGFEVQSCAQDKVRECLQ